MIQYRDPLKKLFIYSDPKSKSKQITAQPKAVLNLKNKFLYCSKQINKKNTYQKKTNTDLIKKTLFLLKMLLIDFTKLIKQKLVKKISVLHKKTIEKEQNISKNTCFFIENIVCVFFTTKPPKTTKK